MGMCPAWRGTNVPSIDVFRSTIFLEQFTRIKTPKKRMSHKSIYISACGTMGSIILFDFPRLVFGLFFSTYRLLIKA
jgi:hypothetical protein